MSGELRILLLAAVPIVVAIGMTGLMLVVSRQVARAQRERKAAIAVLCTQRGLLATDVSADFVLLGTFNPRWLGNSYASADHAVAIADFIRPAEKNTQFFSVLTFTIAGLNMPYVLVERRILGGIFIGGPSTVELESIDFDRRFTVRAKDRRSAIMLLDPGIMQLLIDCDQVNFHMLGDRVLAFVNRASEQRHQPAEPVEFEQLFRFLEGFAARMPQLLRTEYAAVNPA